MKRFLLFILALSGIKAVHSAPIPEQLVFEVIIDTDGAIDDMRAIGLLLSRPEVKIKAILLSDGSVEPGESYSRIRALLSTFGADTIPVGAGTSLEGLNPAWRKFNMGINYGQVQTAKAPHNAVQLLTQLAEDNSHLITLLCLGPLTNIKQTLEQNSGIANKIGRIIWYGNPIDSEGQDFNFSCDTSAADYLMGSGIQMTFLSNTGNGNDIFDEELFTVSRDSDTPLAAFLRIVHSQPEVNDRLLENHFKWFDELVVFYLLNSELFDIDISKTSIKHRYNLGYNTFALRQVYADMIKGTYLKSNNVVFHEFPDDPEFFTYDVREIMDSAILLYGKDEWKANVMTDEFHGHLGVFSIVGAKMGTLAKEIFGVQNDQLQVISYAGQTPPYSCLSDGLQVSTGATLGMGTISLANDSVACPSAIFKFGGKAVKMTLKPEYLQMVNSDINEGIVKFGLADEGYWKLVRRNALRYWLEWDRNEIFIIEEIN